MSPALRALYDEYVRTVSPADMAVGWPTLTYLVGLVAERAPGSVLDLGSGASSAILRAAAPPGVAVVTVDDSPEWLAKTFLFLQGHGLPTGGMYTLAAFNAHRGGAYDLVVHDLSSIPVRARCMAWAADRTAPGGTLVLDDYNRPAVEAAARRLPGWRVEPLAQTLDEYGRFAARAERVA